MGMNYYAIKKKDLEKQRKITEFFALDKEDQRVNKLKEFVKDEYKEVIDLINDFDIEESGIEDIVGRCITNIQFELKAHTECDYKHIGKSSYGWLFLFQFQKEWSDYNSVMNWLKNNQDEYTIVNEEDEEVSFEDFKRLVDDKQADEHNLSNPENFNNCFNIDGYRFSTNDFS